MLLQKRADNHGAVVIGRSSSERQLQHDKARCTHQDDQRAMRQMMQGMSESVRSSRSASSAFRAPAPPSSALQSVAGSYPAVRAERCLPTLLTSTPHTCCLRVQCCTRPTRTSKVMLVRDAAARCAVLARYVAARVRRRVQSRTRRGAGSIGRPAAMPRWTTRLLT